MHTCSDTLSLQSLESVGSSDDFLDSLGRIRQAAHAVQILLPGSFAAFDDSKDYKSQELVNTAWAFAAAGHKSSMLFDAIAETAISRLKNFISQELAHTVWAIPTIGHTSLGSWGHRRDGSRSLEEFQFSVSRELRVTGRTSRMYQKTLIPFSRGPHGP